MSIIPAATQSGEKRWKLLGKTASGRYLCGVHDPPEVFRTVTAYTMNQAERGSMPRKS
jgi:uncharacterized DUF497 family protein